MVKLMTRGDMLERLVKGEDPKCVALAKWNLICKVIREHMNDSDTLWLYKMAYGGSTCALCEVNREGYNYMKCWQCAIDCRETWSAFDCAVSNYFQDGNAQPMLYHATEMVKLIQVTIPEVICDL